jgi:hypothetical protein
VKTRKAARQVEQPSVIKQRFTVDPCQSATPLFSMAPEGYKAVKLDRKGTVAVVTYRKIS